LGNIFRDVSVPPSGSRGVDEITSLGRQLYDQDKEYRELVIYLSEGDVLRYNAYMKVSVEKALTLLEFNRERQKREMESLKSDGTNTDRIYGKRNQSSARAK
jgi:hypothetical protein